MMNETEKQNVLEVARTYKNMCVNIDTFCDFLTDTTFDNSNFNPITDRDVLMTGHYANILECKCWVSGKISTGYIKVSNSEITNSKEGKWSPSLSLADTKEFKRLMKLKAFW